MTRYRLDRSWRRPGNGPVVIAGSPLRLFRLSAGAAQVMSLVEAGSPPDTAPVRQLIDRFVDAGALHPEPDRGPYSVADVTVVVPAFGRVPALPRVERGVRIIVVDDASPVPLSIPATAGVDVQVIRRAANGGPGAARNTGLARVVTPLVAFVDSDVHADDGWMTPLLSHFADDRVALVAPRVASAAGTGCLDRYEERHSPLDLGDEPARIAAGTRVGYAPGAAVVCRTAAVRSAGGFDESLTFGEDVDLVWRLTEAGHRCRYEPAAVVHHEPRATWTAWVRQRFGYGSSAAALARRHPGALAPVRMSGWSAAVWALVALRRPALALAAAGGTIVALQRKLGDVPPRESARLVALGHLAAGRQLAKGITRTWWPIALLIAAIVPRARGPVVAAWLAPPVLDAVRERRMGPLADAPIGALDDLAYGTGVWAGVWREREPGPLLPSFRTWPPRGAG